MSGILSARTYLRRKAYMEDDNVKLVRRYYSAWNEGDPAKIEACIAPGFVGHTGTQSFDQSVLIAHRRQMSNEFTKFSVHEEDAVAQRDKVVMRWTSSGLSRRRDVAIEIRGVTIYRIEAGAIAELWDVRNRPTTPPKPDPRSRTKPRSGSIEPNRTAAS